MDIIDRFRCCTGVEGLSTTVGRGGLRRYTGAQVAAGQSVEAGYSVVQQVSKSYLKYLKYPRRLYILKCSGFTDGPRRQLNGLIVIICSQKFPEQMARRRTKPTRDNIISCTPRVSATYSTPVVCMNLRKRSRRQYYTIFFRFIFNFSFFFYLSTVQTSAVNSAACRTSFDADNIAGGRPENVSVTFSRSGRHENVQ